MSGNDERARLDALAALGLWELRLQREELGDIGGGELQDEAERLGLLVRGVCDDPTPAEEARLREIEALIYRLLQIDPDAVTAACRVCRYSWTLPGTDGERERCGEPATVWVEGLEEWRCSLHTVCRRCDTTLLDDGYDDAREYCNYECWHEARLECERWGYDEREPGVEV